MKNFLITITASVLIISCGSKENNASVDDLVKSKDLTAIKAKRDAVQADLVKLETAIDKLDTKKVEEALVSVKTLKDTVFSHYLE